MKIKNIDALEILDSRGNPTVEVKIVLEDGSTGQAQVPSGASIGKYEAKELRDNDSQRYHGLGVLKAVENVKNNIRPVLLGLDSNNQELIDRTMIELDGTTDKSKLGANAILAVSLALARAQSQLLKIPLYLYLAGLNPDRQDKFILPLPLMNVINGGKHADWAVDFQEYVILPAGAGSVTRAVMMCSEIYHKLGEILKSKNYPLNIGDEGGYAPGLKSNSEPLELIMEAITKAGYQAGKDILLGIDAAASSFFQNGKYVLKAENKTLTADELDGYYHDLIAKYPLCSLEDIFQEDDWEGFTKFTRSVNNKIQVIGDDLYVTNPGRLEKGIETKATNSIIIKLNQIGTLTETIETIIRAKRAGLTAIISHRSGETEDAFIADLAVAFSTGQIKSGAPDRSERTAKYNRLMEIEKELGEKGEYARFPFNR